MRPAVHHLRVLESLIPSETGLTVFDAETQETSYSICSLDGLPYIFDTHRIHDHFVATIELLTEVVEPVRLSRHRVGRFCRDARAKGLLSIPYSACFFRDNLHVYAFSGLIRGFDLSALGSSVASSEEMLLERMKAIWRRVPTPIALAQRDLLEGHRAARYPADLDVLLRHWKGKSTAIHQGSRPRGRLGHSDTSRL